MRAPITAELSSATIEDRLTQATVVAEQKESKGPKARLLGLNGQWHSDGFVGTQRRQARKA